MDFFIWHFFYKICFYTQKYFLLGFLHFIVKYKYENWVWLGLELGASLTLQWVSWPPLVTGD